VPTFTYKIAVISSVLCYVALASGITARLHERLQHAAVPGAIDSVCCEHEHGGTPADPTGTQSRDCPVCHHLTLGARTCVEPPMTVAVGCMPARLPRITSHADPVQIVACGEIAPRAPPLS